MFTENARYQLRTRKPVRRTLLL